MVVQRELSNHNNSFNLEVRKSLTMTTDLEFQDKVEGGEGRRASIKENQFSLIHMVLAETIGTGMLVFFGCMGTVHWDGPPSAIVALLNFGITVMTIIHIFGHVSNALINPAVTIAAVVNRMITWQVSDENSNKKFQCDDTEHCFLRFNLFSV